MLKGHWLLQFPSHRESDKPVFKANVAIGDELYDSAVGKFTVGFGTGR